MPDSVVLSFDEFWQWIQGHPNCILSIGTPDAVLYDHDDFHWTFTQQVVEGHEELVVQVIRGKSLIGEVLLPRGALTHVQGEEREEGEYTFECFVETPEGPVASYYFAMSHGYTPDEPRQGGGSWVH